VPALNGRVARGAFGRIILPECHSAPAVAERLLACSVSIPERIEMRRNHRLALFGAVLAAMTFTAGPALATPPGPGVTGVVLVDYTVKNTRYVLREVTIPPGQSTGWHYHDGPVRAVIESGTLSHFDASCRSDGTYRAGRLLFEPTGAGHAHVTRNLGNEPVVMAIRYTLPVGAPLSQDIPNPGCDFQ
jgi:quercetin dioxygenase-like cupin family protein